MSRNVIHMVREAPTFDFPPTVVPPDAWNYGWTAWKNSSYSSPTTLYTYDADYPAVIVRIGLHSTYNEPHVMVLEQADSAAQWFLSGGGPINETSSSAPAPSNIVIDLWDKPHVITDDIRFYMAHHTSGASGIILAHMHIYEWEA